MSLIGYSGYEELAWERFWCPREGVVRLDWWGFLLPPGEEGLAQYLVSDVVPATGFESLPCVALLGEPGMGKSHEIRRLAHRTGERTIFRDLRKYDSTSAISLDLLASDDLRSWLDGDHRLTIFLDSLDEALLEIRVLAHWLTDELRKLPTERLSLRIACRTAHVPPELEWGLRGIWGEESYRAYEITPLSLADVRLAAEAKGLDVEAFLTEVVDRGAVALASRPTTLAFLVESFARNESFPPTQAELFKVGCEQLCTEDPSRRQAGHAGDLSPQQRLAVASRIAAATMFGNRSAVWRGTNPAAKPSAEVAIAELIGGTEPVDGGPGLYVTEGAIEETLGTGLFSARGPVSLGWAHQSYAEFLAALWIVQHELPIPQVDGLIRYQVPLDRRFIPQLREPLGWLSAMHTEARRLVLDAEPEILLDADPATATAADRAALTAALLDLARRGELAFPEFGRRRRYDRLAHPNLASQLRPVVVNTSEEEAVRGLALEIAAAAGVEALEDDCVAIALAEREPMGLRVDAARLIASTGGATARSQLLPLATEPQVEDIDDDLKGTALRAVWPDHLGSYELFEALQPAKRPNRSGAYDGFLRELAEGLPPEALVPGLRWASDHRSRLSMDGRLADSIVRQAWIHLDHPGVLAAFADMAADRFARYQDLVDREQDEFAALVAEWPDARQMLVEALVERMGTEIEQITVPFTHRMHFLVTVEDFEWLLERTVACQASDSRGEAWARLLREVMDIGSPGVFEKLYEFRDHPHIEAVFGGWWKPVLLDSEAAERLRDHHRKMEGFRQGQRERPPPPTDLPSASRLMEVLRSGGELSAAAGDTTADAWVRAAQELTRSEDGRRFQYGLSLHGGPTWDLLDKLEKEEVLDHAAWYVSDRATSVDEWISDGGATGGSWAGDRAFRLLEAQRPAVLDSLPDDVWKSWVPVLLMNRPLSGDATSKEGHDSLLRRAYLAAPDATISTAQRVLLQENQEHRALWSLSSLAPLWDGQFGAAMLELAKNGDLAPSAFRPLLEELISREVAGATEFAGSLLRSPLPRRAGDRDRAVEAAAALLVVGRGEGWEVVAPVLRRAPRLRREVAVSAASKMTRLNRFSEHQLAEMFSFLAKEFPYPDPWRVGVYSPTGADEARSWRSNVIAELRDRATPAAVAALEGVREDFPELEWLNHTILKCREALRRETWKPPAVRDLLALAEEADRRIVESGEHLLDAITESLDRFEGELHGELPAVSGLWDRLEDGRYRPKDEQELADAVARHLRRDLGRRGIAAGREVVIRRGGAGGVPGHRTDLYVTAVPEHRAGDRSPITAIIEVKGSWHPEVLTAMETQLVGDYINANPQARHGLYLVGWYLCDRWKEGLRKRRTQQLGGRRELVETLTEQAQRLSTDELRVGSYVLDVSWR